MFILSMSYCCTILKQRLTGDWRIRAFEKTVLCGRKQLRNFYLDNSKLEQ